MDFLEPVVSNSAILNRKHIGHSIISQLHNTGRHCCLWCNITSDKLVIPKGNAGRSNIAFRSLDTLSERHAAFLSTGGANLKKAKLFDNVIGKTFFDIPLKQVTETINN